MGYRLPTVQTQAATRGTMLSRDKRKNKKLMRLNSSDNFIVTTSSIIWFDRIRILIEAESGQTKYNLSI